jgi:CRISPR-associated protein Cas5h
MSGKPLSRLLVFDLKADVGHFRRPDTTATHATYPFITRTALRGLLGSILGMDRWDSEAWTGLQLLRPVVTRAQQLSLLSKFYLGAGGTKPTNAFNRPTSIELVVKPYYRIYYSGDYFDELHGYIEQSLSVYHTYLGSAFALTKPRFIGIVEAKEQEPEGVIECLSVVPSHLVDRLELTPGHQYMRAGGVPYHSIDKQSFEGTMNFIYERSGRTIHLKPSSSEVGVQARWTRLHAGGWVNLW